MDPVIVDYASKIESGLYSGSNKEPISFTLSYKLSKIPETLKFSS